MHGELLKLDTNKLELTPFDGFGKDFQVQSVSEEPDHALVAHLMRGDDHYAGLLTGDSKSIFLIPPAKPVDKTSPPQLLWRNLIIHREGLKLLVFELDKDMLMRWDLAEKQVNKLTQISLKEVVREKTVYRGGLLGVPGPVCWMLCKQDTVVKGVRDGGGALSDGIQFAIYKTKYERHTENWDFPPATFLNLVFDENDEPILQTAEEGIFRLKDGAWKRISAPLVFDFKNPRRSLMHKGKVIFVEAGMVVLRESEVTASNPKIFIYDPKENEYQQLELVFKYPAQSPILESGIP